MPGSYTASHAESHVRALHPRHNRSSHTSSAQPRAHASTPGKASHASMAPQRPLPTANGHFQRPTVTSNGQRPLPMANGHFQWPFPTVNGRFRWPMPTSNGHFQWSTATSNGQRPLPTGNAHFQRPTAASNGRFQRPLPTAKCLPHPRAGGEGCRGGSGRVALSLVCRRVVSLVAALGPGATASPGGQPTALSRRPPESERLSMKAGSFGTGVKKPPPRPAPFFGRRPQQGAASFFGPNKAIFVYLFMYWEIKIENA